MSTLTTSIHRPHWTRLLHTKRGQAARDNAAPRRTSISSSGSLMVPASSPSTLMPSCPSCVGLASRVMSTHSCPLGFEPHGCST